MDLTQSILIELTWNCNHRCVFCSCPWLSFPELRGRELDCTRWCRILEQAVENDVKHITLSGGEPLLKEDFIKILLHAAKLPFESVAVFSNGLAIDEDMLDIFSMYHIQWATSLPGIFNFRRLTNSSMSPRNLLEKVKLAAKKNIPVTVNITAVRKNLWEMPLTMLLAKFYGASALSVGPCMPEGRALEHPELYLSDRQYRKLLSWATIFNGKFNIPVRFSYEQRCECYNTDGTPTGIVPESCTAGKTFMVISPDGVVRKCMHSPEKICSFEEFLTR